MKNTELKEYLDKIEKEKKNQPSFTGVLISLIMALSGFYLLLNKIVINSGFGLSRSLYHYGGVGITGGMILVPMAIGIFWIFYNTKSIFAWTMLLASMVSLIFGVISSATVRLAPMTSFDFIVIAVLAFGGLGMLLKNLGKK